MKRLKQAALLTTVIAGFFLLPTQLHAVDIRFNIDLGGHRMAPPPPRPPVVIARQWSQPAPAAVWVEPHYEWTGSGWIWVNGYYTYPPRAGMVWIPAHIEHSRNRHVWVGGCWR